MPTANETVRSGAVFNGVQTFDRRKCYQQSADERRYFCVERDVRDA